MKMPQFRLVKQPLKSRLCGAAVCAIALGKSLEEVLSEVDWRSLTHTGGIVSYLGRYCISMGWWIGWEQHHTNESFRGTCLKLEGSASGRPAILAVRSAIFKDADHWVFWDGKQILDPSIEQTTYHLLEIHFLTYWPDKPACISGLPEDWNDDVYGVSVPS